MSQKYQLGDLVWCKSDNCPFEVVGVRPTTTEIHGDWSGGMAPAYIGEGVSWVSNNEIEPWKPEFLGKHRKLGQD